MTGFSGILTILQIIERKIDMKHGMHKDKKKRDMYMMGGKKRDGMMMGGKKRGMYAGGGLASAMQVAKAN